MERVIMFTRRSRHEIIYSMLETVKKHNPGVPQTLIMYRSNLSYRMLKTYLGVLLKNQLVRAETLDEKQVYSITDRGREFIKTYEHILSILGQ